jgi:hypothetical protein
VPWTPDLSPSRLLRNVVRLHQSSHRRCSQREYELILCVTNSFWPFYVNGGAFAQTPFIVQGIVFEGEPRYDFPNG